MFIDITERVLMESPLSLRACIGTMNPPLTPPRRGTDRTRTNACSPPRRGRGWVGSWRERRRGSKRRTIIFRKKFAVNTTLAKSSAAVRLCSMYCDRSSRSPGLIPPCSSWSRPAQARNSSHEPFTTAARAKNRVLVKVNCGAISTGLVESELFGHVKGPFTGAISNRDGRFKLADSGTIFLDEVGELPLDTQVKLLRVLQELEFERIGSSKTLKLTVFIVATM